MLLLVHIKQSIVQLLKYILLNCDPTKRHPLSGFGFSIVELEEEGIDHLIDHEHYILCLYFMFRRNFKEKTGVGREEADSSMFL